MLDPQAARTARCSAASSMNFVIMTAKTFWKRELIRALVRGDLRYTATRFRWCKRWRIAVSPALHLSKMATVVNLYAMGACSKLCCLPCCNREAQGAQPPLRKLGTLSSSATFRPSGTGKASPREGS
jgi:hypothetical protein